MTAEDWRSLCEQKALSLWPEFQRMHPYVVNEPDGTQILPGPGVAYPSLFAAHLEHSTGIAGWRVDFVRKRDAVDPHWEFQVTPPPKPSAEKLAIYRAQGWIA